MIGPEPGSIYRLDLYHHGLVLKQTPDRPVELIRQPTRERPDAPVLRTIGASSQEAWEKMWALLIREQGGWG